MRFKSRRPQMRDTVLLSGWLFADLFLALAIIFLSANTAGIKLAVVPTPTPTPFLTVVPTPTATPTTFPTVAPLPRLELKQHRIILTDVDTGGLLNNTPGAITALKQQIKGQSFLNGRAVGLVIAYGGASDVTQVVDAQNIANKVMDVLRSLGTEGFAFARSSYYEPLYILYGAASTVVIDVYLFA